MSSTYDNWIPIDNGQIFEDDFTAEETGNLFQLGGSLGVVFLILVAIIIAGIYMTVIISQIAGAGTSTNAKKPPPPPQDGNALTSTRGSGNQLSGWTYNGYDRTTQPMCESDGRGIWNGSNCSCISPFWGTNCQNEGYSNIYVELGNPITNSGSGDDTHLDIIAEYMTDRLSFPLRGQNNNQSICTDICDDNADCVGVLWTPGSRTNPGICKLFSGAETNSVIPFNNEGNNIPTLYVRNNRIKTHIRLPNRVVLFNETARQAANKFLDGVVYRYWINLRNNDMVIIKKGGVRQITFVPTADLNQSGLTGYYSLNRFTPDDIYNPEFNFYIHQPGTSLVIPASWYGLVIYVMYI